MPAIFPFILSITPPFLSLFLHTSLLSGVSAPLAVIIIASGYFVGSFLFNRKDSIFFQDFVPSHFNYFLLCMYVVLHFASFYLHTWALGAVSPLTTFLVSLMFSMGTSLFIQFDNQEPTSVLSDSASLIVMVGTAVAFNSSEFTSNTVHLLFSPVFLDILISIFELKIASFKKKHHYNPIPTANQTLVPTAQTPFKIVKNPIESRSLRGLASMMIWVLAAFMAICLDKSGFINILTLTSENIIPNKSLSTMCFVVIIYLLSLPISFNETHFHRNQPLKHVSTLISFFIVLTFSFPFPGNPFALEHFTLTTPFVIGLIFTAVGLLIKIVDQLFSFTSTPAEAPTNDHPPSFDDTPPFRIRTDTATPPLVRESTPEQLARMTELEWSPYRGTQSSRTSTLLTPHSHMSATPLFQFELPIFASHTDNYFGDQTQRFISSLYSNTRAGSTPLSQPYTPHSPSTTSRYSPSYDHPMAFHAGALSGQSISRPVSQWSNRTTPHNELDSRPSSRSTFHSFRMMEPSFPPFHIQLRNQPHHPYLYSASGTTPSNPSVDPTTPTRSRVHSEPTTQTLATNPHSTPKKRRDNLNFRAMLRVANGNPSLSAAYRRYIVDDSEYLELLQNAREEPIYIKPDPERRRRNSWSGDPHEIEDYGADRFFAAVKRFSEAVPPEPQTFNQNRPAQSPPANVGPSPIRYRVTPVTVHQLTEPINPSDQSESNQADLTLKRRNVGVNPPPTPNIEPPSPLQKSTSNPTEIPTHPSTPDQQPERNGSFMRFLATFFYYVLCFASLWTFLSLVVGMIRLSHGPPATGTPYYPPEDLIWMEGV